MVSIESENNGENKRVMTYIKTIIANNADYTSASSYAIAA
jgi:hypothetical protein